MKTRVRLLGGIGLVGMALLIAALPGPAAAQDVRQESSLTVAAPDEVALGDRGLIVAVLRDAAGAPIEGATIKFFSPATLGGAVGEMELGEAVTDAAGTAVFEYQMRVQGENEFTGRFFGNDAYRPVQSSAVVAVTGSGQLFRAEAGVRLPVFGGWTLAAVLLGVWSVYFSAMFMVTRIAREGA